MFLDYLARKYKEYKLRHLLMLLVLFLYSLIGAICFVALEKHNEKEKRFRTKVEFIERSVAAKRILVNHIKVCC